MDEQGRKILEERNHFKNQANIFEIKNIEYSFQIKEL
jgi:hypothetical protein